MLFFIVCACFALFPEQVLYGAQNGLALCINAVIPSLLPFMVVSACIIKSNFSKPLGAVIAKILTPLTGISPCGCVCFVTGMLGGYGAGARAVCESFRQGQISKSEAEKLLPFCNNAGPLFVIGTIGISFFSNKTVGINLFLIQLLTALMCAALFGEKCTSKQNSVREAWMNYKKNKPSFGKLITDAAIESGGAIVTACVFVIAFSAILEVVPLGKYDFMGGVLEVTRGSAVLSRYGYDTLPVISALLAWGGLSVHFQANALTQGLFAMKNYYTVKLIASVMAYIIAKLCLNDLYIFLAFATGCTACLLFAGIIRKLFFRESARQRGFRQQPRS